MRLHLVHGGEVRSLWGFQIDCTVQFDVSPCQFGLFVHPTFVEIREMGSAFLDGDRCTGHECWRCSTVFIQLIIIDNLGFLVSAYLVPSRIHFFLMRRTDVACERHFFLFLSLFGEVDWTLVQMNKNVRQVCSNADYHFFRSFSRFLQNVRDMYSSL